MKVKRHNWDKSRSNFDIKLRLKRVVKGRHWHYYESEYIDYLWHKGFKSYKKINVTNLPF
jgi:hypothetical protein